jgi:hypothetical protein
MKQRGQAVRCIFSFFKGKKEKDAASILHATSCIGENFEIKIVCDTYEELSGGVKPVLFYPSL